MIEKELEEVNAKLHRSEGARVEARRKLQDFSMQNKKLESDCIKLSTEVRDLDESLRSEKDREETV